MKGSLFLAMDGFEGSMLVMFQAVGGCGVDDCQGWR